MSARIFSARQAAAFLGISPARVRQLLLDKRIRGELVGRGYVIYQSELERFARKPRKPGRPWPKGAK